MMRNAVTRFLCVSFYLQFQLSQTEMLVSHTQQTVDSEM